MASVTASNRSTKNAPTTFRPLAWAHGGGPRSGTHRGATWDAGDDPPASRWFSHGGFSFMADGEGTRMTGRGFPATKPDTRTIGGPPARW